MGELKSKRVIILLIYLSVLSGMEKTKKLDSTSQDRIDRLFVTIYIRYLFSVHECQYSHYEQ